MLRILWARKLEGGLQQQVRSTVAAEQGLDKTALKPGSSAPEGDTGAWLSQLLAQRPIRAKMSSGMRFRERGRRKGIGSNDLHGLCARDALSQQHRVGDRRADNSCMPNRRIRATMRVVALLSLAAGALAQSSPVGCQFSPSTTPGVTYNVCNLAASNQV